MSRPAFLLDKKRKSAYNNPGIRRRMKKVSLFFSYLRDRFRTLCAFFFLLAINLLSFFLYRLPLEAVLYPSGLFLLCGCVALLIDFGRVRKKHLRLQTIKHRKASLIPSLENNGSVCESDYCEMIKELCAQTVALENAARDRYTQTVEYFTLWAHQIKIPIASMQLSLQNEDTAYTRRLRAELRRIEQYVEMVLTYLRLESEESDYVFHTCSLDELLRENIRSFSAEFINRHLKLVYEPTNRMIVTDEKWFSFLIGQLLSNALKYTPSGEVRIFMQDADTLCIRDTGIGIAEEDLPRIFDKGYTGYNGRIDRQASGIGLYLCRRICEKLSVGIRISSQVGEGTSVLLQLGQYDLHPE